MRIAICAIGRLRAGPEKILIDDFLGRFDKVGRQLGLGSATVTELDDRKGGGMAAEAVLLQKALPKSGTVCALDERGRTLTSPEFADLLASWRDAGRGDASFVMAQFTNCMRSLYVPFEIKGKDHHGSQAISGMAVQDRPTRRSGNRPKPGFRGDRRHLLPWLR